jgi:hypothetical protein
MPTRSPTIAIFWLTLYLIGGFLATSVRAATFEVKTEKNGEYEYDVIYLNGPIEAGDERQFLSLALNSKRDILVSLNSQGGDLKTALEIGQLISLRGYSTGITKTECVSACGLIWLAGMDRYLNNGERVGFHSPFRLNPVTQKREVDAVGSSLVGAYVRKLDLPSIVVSLVVEAPPEDITWITNRNAATFGLITYRRANVIAYQLHNKAFTAGQNRRYTDALKLYREAARAGFAGSQNNLGDMYERGEGLAKKSDSMAVYWYTRAAERGEPFGYWSLSSTLARTAVDPAGMIEAAKFCLLAVEHLPPGPDRDAAKKHLRELKARMSGNDFRLAISAAKQWEPLQDDGMRLSADDEI